MQTRTRVLLAVAGIWLVTNLGPSVADEPKPAATPKMTNAEFQALMESISNWNRWGADDQLGALNLITPEKRKSAAALVTEGATVSLAHTLTNSTADAASFDQKMLNLPADQELTFASDQIRFAYHGFTITHMDALCHMFYKGKMYNGYPKKDVSAQGAAKLAISYDAKQGIVTRGVLVDLPKLFGTRFVEGGQAILPKHLDAWEKAAEIKVGSGDAVLIHTGRWQRAKLAGDWDIMKNTSGLHVSCLKWLKDRDVAVIGSDLALDVLPSGVEGVEFPVHCGVLVGMGMPILDNLDLDAVSEAAAARKRWEFLLTVAPLAVQGGTGSPVNPLATF